MWSIRNIVRVALMQVGAVIASIFVGGIYHKFSTMSEPPRHMVPYQNWWYHYGFLGLAFPMFWVACSLYLYSHDNMAEPTKFVIFWFGVLAVVVLAILVVISLLRLFMPDIQM